MAKDHREQRRRDSSRQEHLLSSIAFLNGLKYSYNSNWFSRAISVCFIKKIVLIFVLVHPFSLYDDLDLIKVVGIGYVATLVLIISIFYFVSNIFITSFYVRVYKYKRKWKTVNINVSCFGLQPIWARNSNTHMGQDKIDAGSTPVWPCTSQTHI